MAPRPCFLVLEHWELDETFKQLKRVTFHTDARVACDMPTDLTFQFSSARQIHEQNSDAFLHLRTKWNIEAALFTEMSLVPVTIFLYYALLMMIYVYSIHHAKYLKYT
jgi:hypothetical protein